MDNVTVNMLDNTGVVLASAITNSNGYYEITSMPAGVVTHVEVSTDKTWGGGNSTDALAIQRRTVNFPVTFWNPVAFIDNVASVRNTGIVNSTDALFVRHRAIQLITGFPAGDWAFWASDYGVNFSKLSPVVTNKARIAISEVHTNTLNIQALCYGDVNGSYTPGNGKSSMVLQSNEVTRVIPNTAFELPLIPENEMDFSALTLFVQYASQKLNILEVKSNIPGIEYSIVDGWVNVAWSNLKPVHINAGEALITFVIATTEPVSENDELFNLGGATEFANEYSEVLSNYKLSINRIDNSMNSALHCYPNPFNEELNISYVLAEPGNVRISIVNSMGAVVSQIVNRYHDAGAYSIPLDPEFYGINNRGMYFIRIEAQGESTVFNKLFKVMYAY
jgi:hypothetical protein